MEWIFCQTLFFFFKEKSPFWIVKEDYIYECKVQISIVLFSILLVKVESGKTEPTVDISNRGHLIEWMDYTLMEDLRSQIESGGNPEISNSQKPHSGARAMEGAAQGCWGTRPHEAELEREILIPWLLPSCCLISHQASTDGT